ncbi:hypothetical protein L6164_025707 [Bauhinia variegata]|uniref:Uncharacterized protein n=1 Tax=Bauhinia variegata TaxID=167791 RepID=A0ACB9M2S1_BAUVA|nr:hypothetical protein L6164_025707 [Bauhinia variegata]
MLSKLRVLKLFPHRLPRRVASGNASRYFLYSNPLCTMLESQKITESPELPGWLKAFQNQSPENADSDEDFVIPSLASWVDARMVDGQTRVLRHPLSQDKDADVEAISKVLKERYPSPEKATQALNGCAFLLSNSLAEQILKRFNNVWISAFGFFNWAKTQTGYDHSPELYTFMVDILGKSKKFDLMWKLVEEMRQLGYLTFDTMTKVMRRLSKAGEYKEAIESFRRLEEFGINKDTASLNVLLDALVKGNSVENAQNVAMELKNSIPLNSHSFNVLIHGWCKIRKFDKADEVMEDMKKHGFHPDAISYTSYIEAYCREKDFRKVDEVFEKMKEDGCLPNTVTYTIVMHALGKAGQLTEALEVYEKMKHNGCVPDAKFYSSLIFILGQAGRLKDAREVFDDMPKQGVTPDVVTYNTMISIACNHSQEEEALKLLKEMEESPLKPDLETYHPLLKMCCRKKRMKVLNFLLDHMFRNDLSLDLATYTLLVNGLCKSGKPERASFFFEEMISRGLSPSVKTFKILVEELEQRSMLKEKEHVKSLMAQARSEKQTTT